MVQIYIRVDVIAQKIPKSVLILFKLSKYLPLEIIKTYYSLINPFLLYGIEVSLGKYANITDKIFILKKRHAGPSIICLSKLTQPNTLKMKKKRSIKISNL